MDRKVDSNSITISKPIERIAGMVVVCFGMRGLSKVSDWCLGTSLVSQFCLLMLLYILSLEASS